MLLEIVLDTRDVRSDFHTVRETNSGNLSNRRVRLTWSLGSYFCTHTTLERREILVWLVLDLVKTRFKSSCLSSTSAVASLITG